MCSSSAPAGAVLLSHLHDLQQLVSLLLWRPPVNRFGKRQEQRVSSKFQAVHTSATMHMRFSHKPVRQGSGFQLVQDFAILR